MEQEVQVAFKRPVYVAPSPMVIIVGTMMGGFLAFVWGMMAWMMIGIHDSSVRQIPNQEIIAQGLMRDGLKTGFYQYPAMQTMPGPDGKKEKFASKDDEKLGVAHHSALHKQGPIFSIIYQEKGSEVMTGKVMFTGLFLNMVSAFIMCVILYCSLGIAVHFWQRAMLVFLMAYQSASAHLLYWNWMQFPWDHTVAMVTDVMIGWILIGLLLAKLIAPQRLRDGETSMTYASETATTAV
jgi:hypothetical protein